jgi:hypothetical protein
MTDAPASTRDVNQALACGFGLSADEYRKRIIDDVVRGIGG